MTRVLTIKYHLNQPDFDQRDAIAHNLDLEMSELTLNSMGTTLYGTVEHDIVLSVADGMDTFEVMRRALQIIQEHGLEEANLTIE